MTIKVLYLHHVEQISGAENSLLLLLRNLDRSQVVPFFAGPGSGPFPTALAAENIPVLPVPFGRLRNLAGVARSVRRIRKLIEDWRIDLLHSNGPQTNVCAGIAGRLANVPSVWHARNLLEKGMWDVDRKSAWLASRIICNSDAIRARFRGSRAWQKTVTILNAVDTREFGLHADREAFRREMGLSPGAPAVGIVGRIGTGKGHEYFIDAAITLLRAGSPAKFFIVGDPLFSEDVWRPGALGQRVKDAGFEGRIQFIGLRRDMPQVMRGLDVLVLASDAEPCGRVLFEAMASGTAVVATNTGGTPEIVRDGTEGILIPPRNSEALADAIGVLLDAPRLREKLGRNGVARVLQEFAVDRYVARTLEVYEQAVSR
jgi:glycosyltransferase involved in cell wall biosynthesis